MMQTERQWSWGLDWHAWNIGFTWYPGSWAQIYFGPLFFGWSLPFPKDEMDFDAPSNDDSLTTVI